MTKRKKIPYGTKVPVMLTGRQLDLIRDETFCDPNLVNLAVANGDVFRLNLSLDTIEEIQGYVASEANHTKNKKLKKELNQLFMTFQNVLDKYDDQE